jgi:hypothetical protein
MGFISTPNILCDSQLTICSMLVLDEDPWIWQRALAMVCKGLYILAPPIISLYLSIPRSLFTAALGSRSSSIRQVRQQFDIWLTGCPFLKLSCTFTEVYRSIFNPEFSPLLGKILRHRGVLLSEIKSLHFAAVLRLVSQIISIQKYFVNNVCCQFWSSKEMLRFPHSIVGSVLQDFCRF